MFTVLLPKLLGPLLVVLFLLLPAVWLHERGLLPGRVLLGRFRRLARFAQVFAAVFVVGLVVHGSTKNSGTNGPAPRVQAPVRSGPDASASGRLSDEQLAAGFVLRRAVTDAAPDFAPPPSAVVHGPWLLRGAHEDRFTVVSDADHPWAFPFGTGVVRRATVCAQGVVELDGGAGTLVPLGASLGILPRANHGLLPTGCAPSRFWHAATPEGGLLLTWQNAALARTAAAPISVQVELKPSGAFVYRYRLPSVPDSLYGDHLLVGAWNGAHGESLSDNVPGFSYADFLACAGSCLALEWHPLDPRDAVTEDRDGDGLSTYDELFVQGTDPGRFDTDGDGMGDGEEVVRGLDARSRDSDGDGLVDGADPDPLGSTDLADDDADRLPDAWERHWFGGTNVVDAAAARDATGFTTGFKLATGMHPVREPSVDVVVTNSVVAYRLWDGFAAPWTDAATNLVYERTVACARRNSWQQYFLSSRPDGAGGWTLDGLVLEWEDASGASGHLAASPFADSFRLPLGEDATGSLTFRLRATAGFVQSGTPVYLVAYAPKVDVRGGQRVRLSDGTEASVFTHGSESLIELAVDRSRRPCRADLSSDERAVPGLDAMGLGTDFVYEGDCTGGRIRALRAGVFELPQVELEPAGVARARRAHGRSAGAGRKVYVLSPSVGYSGSTHCAAPLGIHWENPDREDFYYEWVERYPLDSSCLWRNWWRGSHVGYACTCELSASSGIGTDPEVTVSTGVNGNATVSVGGSTVWTGHAAHDQAWTCDGFQFGSPTLLNDLESCDTCESSCEDGNCDGLEGDAPGSVKFRIPLGVPAKNVLAGFVYFHLDAPARIGLDTFEHLFHPDATNVIEVVETATSRRVTCRGARGRDLLLETIADGVRITIDTTATGALEHTWEITNPDGDTGRFRFRKISSQRNIMSDWTYACEPQADGGYGWSAFDNVARIGRRWARVDRLNDPAARSVEETTETFDEQDRFLGRVRTVSVLVGECGNAVLREVLREEDTGTAVRSRTADYWRDDAWTARNGCVRLVQGSDTAWAYHDWDGEGREILRVEQLDGSPVPASFPTVATNGLAGLAPDLVARVTVLGYEPQPGDTAPRAETMRPRSETRYVVRDGQAVCIGRTWNRYRNVSASGLPCVRHEVWRASGAASRPGDASCAYSSQTVVEDLGIGVSTVLSGQLVESLDADGVRTAVDLVVTNGVVVRTTRRYTGDRVHPTYEVEELDATHGTRLRRATCLTEGNVVLDEEVSSYDDKNRLRATSYSDGTSLTNAYSCCRLLWSRDRDGRRRLRSGRTGSDHLYNADEEVWMQAVNPDGYRVTQHFLDARGRETNTVVYVGTVPGEANDWTVSEGRWQTSETKSYPDGGDDHVIARDARGRLTETWTVADTNRVETRECVYTNGLSGFACQTTTTTRIRNGGTVTRREWDGQWTERTTADTYDADGRRVTVETTASSDYGLVTNSVAVSDWLGRTVLSTTPTLETAYAYDGTSGRVASETTTGVGLSRTTTHLYDDLGRETGTELDGVETRSEEAYELADGVWWKVVRQVVRGGVTNAVTETREQLTGLSDACRARRIRIAPDGVATETVRAYDAATGRETETTAVSGRLPSTRVSVCGVTLQAGSGEGTRFLVYDALGRVVREERTRGASSERLPVKEQAYNVHDDLVGVFTYTNGVDGVHEGYAYDQAGNRIAATNALGAVTTSVYDVLGRLVEEAGATYPVRYAYDTAGRRTEMSTTRDGVSWDATRWTYDPATGWCRTKTYADGTAVHYAYTPDGRLLQTRQPSFKVRGCVYDARRNLVCRTVADGAHEAVFRYDAFGRVTCESNLGARVVYAYGPNGAVTNETTTVGGATHVFVRTLDAYGRVSGRGFADEAPQTVAYTPAGRIGCVATPQATATYAYDVDGNETGCTLALASGTVFTRTVRRDVFRPELVTAVTNCVDGVPVGGFAYGHDACARTVRRNADVFGYNARGEVTAATVAGVADAYAYDGIGNRTAGSGCAYTANALNQYLSIAGAGAALAPAYTVDGELAAQGAWTYAYDACGRLAAASSNGVEVLRNAYDAQGRRVRVETASATRTFVYDGWNPVREEVAWTNGVTDVVRYFWGRDLSGGLEGAGGVGGLLYLTVNGTVYVPLYDANGHVVAYHDASGAVVAAYAYDAFGRKVSETGPLADLFRIRYSTKYRDAETGLYSYGHRFYDPVHARWLTRDPIEEQGGLNLYAFCGNDGVNRFDMLGCSSRSVPTPKEVREHTIRSHRNAWLIFASTYWCNLWLSPLWLRHSLQDNPSDLHYKDGDRAVGMVKRSNDFARFLSEIAQGKESGPHAGISSIRFYDQDLKTSIHDAKIKYDGKICRARSGAIIVDMDFLMEDIYNFEYHDAEMRKIKQESRFVQIGNNVAFLSQESGAIVPFNWDMRFHSRKKIQH